jgi:hypothetical protein
MILNNKHWITKDSFMQESILEGHDIASKSSHEVDMLDFETLSILGISSTKSQVMPTSTFTVLAS